MQEDKWIHVHELYQIAMAFLGNASAAEKILATVFGEGNSRDELYRGLGGALLAASRRRRWSWRRDAVLESIRAMPARRALLLLWVEVAGFSLSEAGEMLGVEMEEALAELAAGRAGLAAGHAGSIGVARGAASCGCQ